VLVGEEFAIQGIICYPIVGINPWERLERQQVIVGLTCNGPGLQEWASTLVDCYQKMASAVADVRIPCVLLEQLIKRVNRTNHDDFQKVEQTSFGSVEALASLIARTVTTEYGISSVSVSVEKKSALAFVEGSGVEIKRSREFFK
jgi:dihydroneopterin aldolase